MNKTICFTVFMLLILASCGKGNDTDDRFRFITDWEYDAPLSEDESFHCDEIGVCGIKVLDSVMVLGHRLNWSVLSSDGKRKYGDFLSVGQGPGEFVYGVPFVQSSYFVGERDSLIAYLVNNKRSRIVRANLTDIISGGKGNLTERRVNRALKRAWHTVVCDSASLLMSLPNDSITGFRKLLVIGDSLSSKKVTDSLDVMKVADREKINLLGRVYRYNKASGKFVEARSFLNLISVFSKRDGILKRVCIGKNVFDLVEMEKKEINYDGYAIRECAVWDKGFGVISPEGLVEASGPVQSDSSDLLVFDWDGDPIYRTKLPLKINSFDIDWGNGRLIVHDEVNDRVLAYDATPIIERFK